MAKKDDYRTKVVPGFGKDQWHNTECTHGGCDAKAVARGYCKRHWQYYKRKGLFEGVSSPKTDYQSRFWTYVDKTETCWNWMGVTSKGYGYFMKKQRLVSAHRESYIMLVGNIEDNLTIDHLCRNKACVNPEHMELVSMKENILRSNNPAAINARKTHCIRGHELKGRHLYIDKGGGRNCRTCNNMHHRVARKKLQYA